MDEIVEQYSPDRKYKLIFDGFEEPRMGMSICRFSLSDLCTNELIDFSPLCAIGVGQSGFSWSEEGTFLSLPVVDPPNSFTSKENFFIYDIEKRKFSAIHFDNCWVLSGACHNDYIEIEYEDNQIPERIEHDKYPTKRFIKPANLQFKFQELKWVDIIALPRFNELYKNTLVYELNPIDKGWRQFKGQLPKTTEILIWELREFARYGDIQSKDWLAEIEEKTDNINYWVKASIYLGFKNREYPVV